MTKKLTSKVLNEVTDTMTKKQKRAIVKGWVKRGYEVPFIIFYLYD